MEGTGSDMEQGTGSGMVEGIGSVVTQGIGSEWWMRSEVEIASETVQLTGNCRGGENLNWICSGNRKWNSAKIRKWRGG